MEGTAGEQRGWQRVRTYAKFIRTITSLHPKLFIIAVSGASVFALCTVASSMVIRWVIDEVIIPRFDEGGVETSKVVIACALIIGVGILRAAAVVVRRSFAGMTQWRVAETLTGRIADRFVTQPASWHQRQSDGVLVNRGGVDVDTTIAVLAPIPFATSTVLLLVVSGVWLILTDSVMGLVAVALFPVLVVGNIIYERKVSKPFDEAQDALGEFSGQVHESFEAVQLVKVYGAEGRETERLAELANAIRDPRIRAVRIRGTFEACLEFLPSFTNIGLVVLGASRVESGQVSVGELGGFIFMFTLLVFPLRLIGYALSELPYSYAGWAKVRETLDAPIEADPAASLLRSTAPDAVVLDNVSFVFPGEDHPAVNGATATIEAGTVAALVGSTGSGKSTLVDLIGGLIPATSGTIAVPDGTQAIVFQEAFLFGGSVRENIVAGSESFSDDDVWEALRLAQADTFVRELPGHLDTLVGERGITLSGGQRQRVALARALIRRPHLLLLDDTTSALDPATEMAVLDNLRNALTDSTVVMVASRPSTISLADTVLFVADGSITDHGTHRELYERLPAYRDLVDAFETDRSANPNASDAALNAAIASAGGGE
ncbi:MAG TPA: ABC transporter ATP-binding protein [Ilumatobacter sp.]|nr:ABC transporter ATP-binding protein [Ilumatobacter sp.]